MPKILLTCLFLLPLALPLHAEENNALVPVPKLEDDFYDWHQRHAQVLEAIESSKPDLVFIGDSITQRWAQEGLPIFDGYFGSYDTINMGIGGDRTENVLWRLQDYDLDNLDPELAVLKVGTNNASMACLPFLDSIPSTTSSPR